MPDTLVAARDLERTYQHGNTTEVALASATCVVRDGDRIAVVGPSGSGKSTLLHLLGGLDRPTRGEIAWPALGNRDTLRPRQIAFVFQTPSLLPSLTAVENVALPLLLGHMPPDGARRAAMDALARLELAGIADKLPEELSGGQMQRVGVARALAYHPRLILADEPTGQLDGATAHHLLETLLGALASTDTALVIATHDRGVA
ncbi:MAG: ATP-binding cassette domain-containing protein, partial [Gemmatimonadota bacterium]|nr:ATP-binding cassette domain-containing protein [Gemmatimonadota bacterium]